MLNPRELDVMLETLAARLTWLRKRLESGQLLEAEERSFKDSAQLLTSGIQQLKGLREGATLALSNGPAGEKAEQRVVVDHDINVLVVDDDAMQRELMVALLGELGFTQVTAVQSAEAALTALTSRQPSFRLILCDWNMPETNGLQLLANVRAQPPLAKIPFVMVTGTSDKEHLKEAIQRGVNDFIAKPVDIQVLDKKLTRLLGRPA